MDKQAFDTLFEQRVASRLGRLGFVSHGKTLTFFDARITVALFRLGGRMTAPGSISHILCFRHSCLRDRTETLPAAAPKEVFDYPYKFKPLGDAEKGLVYRPQNLRYDYERLQWEDAEESAVLQKLDRVATVIEDSFLPWAQTITPARAMSDIAQNGENAWCERMWIEDYAAQIP